MEVVSGLEPFQIIMVGPVKADGIAVPEVGMAGAVVPVVASFMHVGMNVAVQNSHSHVGAVVDREARGHGARVVDEAVESKSELLSEIVKVDNNPDRWVWRIYKKTNTTSLKTITTWELHK